MDEANQQDDAGQGSEEHVITVSIKNTNQPPDSTPEQVDESAPVADTVIAETEIEPSTISDTALTETTNLSNNVLNETTQPSDPVVAPATSLAIQNTKRKKRTILFAVGGVALLVVAAASTWWLTGGGQNDTVVMDRSQTTAPAEPRKLGIAATITDGTVEYMRSDSEWRPLETTTQLQEKDAIRTGPESRAVLTIDDGTAVRLDAETTIELTSLAADSIKIDHRTGTLYSRVVPSERIYAVVAQNATYTALGTAFATTSKLEESGVQVYQSSVKVEGAAEAVAEGKQYYKVHSDTDLVDAVTAIDIDSLIDNEFINWNVSEDEKDASLTNKLGVLPQIKLRSEEKAKEQAAEAARQEAAKAAEQAAKELREAEEKKRSQTAGGKVVRGEMAIIATGGSTVSWTYTGKAVHGYKLVYSKKSVPVFNGPGVGATYFSNMSDTSGGLPKKSEIGSGTYNVRVCAYTNNTEDDACVDYSNTIQVTI